MFCAGYVTVRVCSSSDNTCSAENLSYQSVFLQTNPQPADLSTCSYVIAAPAEVSSSIWYLTGAQGLQLSAAIALIWGLGFAFRALGKFMNESQDSNFKE